MTCTFTLKAGMTSTQHFQLESSTGARSEQNVPIALRACPTWHIPYIHSFALPSFFIDGSNWTIGDHSQTQLRKYAFVIVILIVLGRKKKIHSRRPCLLPLHYGFNEKNDGKPQEKEDKKETVVKSHYIAFSIEKARKAKKHCAGQLHDHWC